MTTDTDFVIVRCASHRARGKLLTLVGEDVAQALFSMRRDTSKGAYRIPARLLDDACAITGVTRMRDGDDLMECWPRFDS